MKFKLFTFLAVALVILASVTAVPLHTNPQSLLPPPSPRGPIRISRSVATGGTITANPNGGQVVKLEIAKGLGARK